MERGRQGEGERSPWDQPAHCTPTSAARDSSQTLAGRGLLLGTWILSLSSSCSGAAVRASLSHVQTACQKVPLSLVASSGPTGHTPG